MISEAQLRACRTSAKKAALARWGGRRLAFEPLWSFCHARWSPVPWARHAGELTFGPGKLAQMCGVTERTPYRWRASGLAEPIADAVASHLGVHPMEIWPDWFEVEETAA